MKEMTSQPKKRDFEINKNDTKSDENTMTSKAIFRRFQGGRFSLLSTSSFFDFFCCFRRRRFFVASDVIVFVVFYVTFDIVASFVAFNVVFCRFRCCSFLLL